MMYSSLRSTISLAGLLLLLQLPLPVEQARLGALGLRLRERPGRLAEPGRARGRERVIGHGRDGPLTRLDRLVVLLELAVRHGEAVPGVGVGRVERDRGPIGVDRLLELALREEVDRPVVQLFLARHSTMRSAFPRPAASALTRSGSARTLAAREQRRFVGGRARGGDRDARALRLRGLGAAGLPSSVRAERAVPCPLRAARRPSGDRVALGRRARRSSGRLPSRRARVRAARGDLPNQRDDGSGGARPPPRPPSRPLPRERPRRVRALRAARRRSPRLPLPRATAGAAARLLA